MKGVLRSDLGEDVCHCLGVNPPRGLVRATKTSTHTSLPNLAKNRAN